jgi:hypothetical protein
MFARRYVIAVLLASVGLVAATWAVAWWLEPLYGDLTRIGGYSERDFGGNAPMEEFRPLVTTFGPLEQPADVLVIGDSFANVWPHQQWQNWLALKTGWRIHTLDSRKIDLNSLMTVAAFRQAPPKVVIWNVVERDLLAEYWNVVQRDLLAEYGSGKSVCESNIPEVSSRPLARHPVVSVAPVAVDRPRFSQLNPGFVRIWVWNAISRRMFGVNYSDALTFKLARDDLFSSKNSDELLVYRNDLRKASWRPSDLARIRCGFADLASRIQANGVTRFVTAIAPDKSTMYRSWLESPSELPESRLRTLLEGFPVPDARLEQVLSSAIAKGTKDIYMPDDTHWNATGQKIVGDAVLQLLITEGVAK